MKNTVRTEVLTLSRVAEGNMGFVIPSYQRPYVWHDEDVLKLFEDIKEAYLGGESHYFIGSVLSAVNSEHDDYELIDGQQRTTTLMLVSLAFKALAINCNLSNVSVRNQMPRLRFEIRDSVLHLFGSQAGLETFTKPGKEAIKQEPYLTRIDAALSVLKQLVDKLNNNTNFDLAEFANFIFNKVQWVNNIVPANMDLNRLFSSLNTAGIQLEPVDLLKSKLFKKLKSEKALYNAIWQACEHTENYFERNLRQLFESADWNDFEYVELHVFNSVKFTSGSSSTESSNAGMSIAALHEELISGKAPENAEVPSLEVKDIEDATVYCRSIVSFDLLLIHTLRIFYARQQWDDVAPRVKAGNLLSIFEPLLTKDELTIKRFIQLLWQVRYQFDTWVVKWVEHDDSNDPQLRLTTQSRSQSGKNYYINRSAKELSNLVQLQAVRNFTGDRSAQYWLTSFLAQLVEGKHQSEDGVLEVLERIDNVLSMTTETQKTASYLLAMDGNPARITWAEQESYFEEPLGTSFEHYWFQKLEYLLWKDGNKANDEKLRKYRITSKNSVEHVHPQNEEYRNDLPHESLNAFGNLVLLSPGENSSYSNQTVAKKKADFHDKPRYDSLKLGSIFSLHDECDKWSTSEITKHQLAMMSLLKKHYEQGEVNG